MLEEGKLTPIPQKEEEATKTVMLKKTMGEIDWTKSAVEIERLVRGLNSWPSAYTYMGGKQLKIWDADVDKEADVKPGEVAFVEKQRFAVGCGKGILWINSLQLEGKKRMDTQAFLLGNTVTPGMRLG